MKYLIVYKTKYGATEDYAHWLGSELSESTVIDVKDFDKTDIEPFDWIIIGGAVYAGQLSTKSFIEKSLSRIKSKKVHLFIVQNAPPDSEESRKPFLSIKQEIRDKISGYTILPGRIDLKKLNVFLRFMFKAFKIEGEDKVNRSMIKDILLIVKS